MQANYNKREGIWLAWLKQMDLHGHPFSCDGEDSTYFWTKFFRRCCTRSPVLGQRSWPCIPYSYWAPRIQHARSGWHEGDLSRSAKHDQCAACPPSPARSFHSGARGLLSPGVLHRLVLQALFGSRLLSHSAQLASLRHIAWRALAPCPALWRKLSR